VFLVAEPVGKLLQLLDLLLLILVCRHQLLGLCLALNKKIFVVAAVALDPALPDLENAAGQRVQELPVVGNQEDRARVTCQIALEPA